METIYTTPISMLEPDTWVNLSVEVIQLWDNDHSAIRQVGVVGDDSGIVKLVSWEKSNLPLLQLEGKYTITKVVISEYDDRLQAAMTGLSVIARIGKESSGETEIPTI